MSSVKIRAGKKHSVKVVVSSSQKDFISERDREMDARAVEAVKTAVAKARFCKKPVAKYDPETKRAYIEYADGKKNYES